MAAKTPVANTVKEYPLGGGFINTVMYFSDIDANDTYASGLGTIVNANFLGSEVSHLSVSSGTITFSAGTNATGWLTITHQGR